jgi:transposase InsO family protein
MERRSKPLRRASGANIKTDRAGFEENRAQRTQPAPGRAIPSQILVAHQHWHIDVSYLNISGTFYYLCSILDGFSRYIVNWDARESMTEADIEIILQGAKEKHPEARPRIISDNSPQFIAKDFREFIRISGMTRPHLAVLPAIERKGRALAQTSQRGVHPARNAVIVG